MFVELDTRHDARYTVSLEWDRDTGKTRIVLANSRDESVLLFCVAAADAGRRAPPSVQVRAVSMNDDLRGVVLADGPAVRQGPAATFASVAW